MRVAFGVTALCAVPVATGLLTVAVTGSLVDGLIAVGVLVAWVLVALPTAVAVARYLERRDRDDEGDR